MASQGWLRVGRLAFIGLVSAGILLVFATYVWSLITGFGLFFFTPDGIDVSRRFVSGLTLYLFLTGYTVLPFSFNVGWAFASLWILFAACIVIVWFGPGKGYLRATKESLAGSFHALFGSSLAFLVVANGMLIEAFILIFSLQEKVGVPTGGIIITNPFEGLFDLSYSVVSEEIGFRILPLGLVSVITLWWLRGTDSGRSRFAQIRWLAKGLLFPSQLREKAATTGGLRGMFTGLQWAVLLLSSIWFGLAHVLSGIGWGPGKFTTAFLDGFVFGVGYLLYGAHVTILMHWFRNYYLQVLDLSRGVGVPAFGWVANLSELGSYAVGLVGWGVLLGYLLLREKGAEKTWTRLTRGTNTM